MAMMLSGVLTGKKRVCFFAVELAGLLKQREMTKLPYCWQA